MKIQSKLLLTPDDVKPSFNDWIVQGIFNPGAIRLPNNKIILYARVAERSLHAKDDNLICPIIVSKGSYNVEYQKIYEEKVLRKGVNVIHLKGGLCRLTSLSHLRQIMLSEDGMKFESIAHKPTFTGEPGDGEYGVEDARLIKIDDTYAMTYVSVCLNEGVSTFLALSKDMKHWERKGVIFRQQNKDVVLFPEKVEGVYVALHRPEGTMDFSKRSIWISHSPDLTYWGNERSIIRIRENAWDDAWLGAGAPPIKTKKGWLVFYHGVKIIENENTYAVGVVLLDLKNPEKILARTSAKAPLIEPIEPYEKSGVVNNVVFPTGAVLTLDGKHILLYSGGADRVVTVKKLALSDVLKSMEYY